MAQLRTKMPPYRPSRDVELSWNSWRRGLNTLLKETEVAKDELVQADNLMLIGKGVPTKRWGTALYYLSAATGSVRGVKGYYLSDGTKQLLTITDQGVLTKKSGTSYAIISGVSWASGYNVSMEQLNDDIYIVNGQRELVRYSTPTLSGFPTIAVPTNTFATGISGVSGTNSYSYRVSALNAVGETLASQYYQLFNQPQDLTMGSVKVSWTGVSTASGVLTGYNIYGRNLGDERFVGSVGPSSTTWIDDGSSDPSSFTFPPTADSTGGVVAKYMKRFEDRLIFAGLNNQPSKVVFTGRVPNHEKTDWSYGGGYISIEPDAGDDITGLEVYENKVIVFKERSIWQITFTFQSVGNYSITVPNVQLLTKSHGCISNRSIQPVENDILFLSRKGVYALGYEPNVTSPTLRTSEISAKVRPFFESLTPTQQMSATAFYSDFKYGLSFPGTDKTIVYDRERLAWMGPWTVDSVAFENYYDESDNEVLLYGDNVNSNIVEFNKNLNNDQGSVIPTYLRTRKDDFGDWTLFKNLKDLFTLFRNVTGTVDVELRLQSRDGQVNTAKSFNIQQTTSNAGWGSFMWGEALWGSSPETGSAIDVNEIYRWMSLNKPTRNIQLIISTANYNDNYELLAIRASARPLGKGFLPASEKV